MNSKRAVIGVAALSAFMGGLVAFLALLSRNEDNASATANKNHKTRSFAINLLTGVSTRACLSDFCFNNEPEALERTQNECQVQDQTLLTKEEFTEFLQNPGNSVRVVSQGSEAKNFITSTEAGSISVREACYSIPYIVEVDTDDECVVPPRVHTPQSCTVSSVPVIVVSDVQSVDYNPDIKPGPLFVLSKLASYAELALSNIHIRPFSHNLGSCFLASNAYLAKKHYNPNHLGIISRKSLKKIQDSGLAKIGEGNIGEEGRQYEVGLFKDYKTPLGIRRVRCSYGIVDNNAGTATYLFHIATPAKNIAAVKRLAGDGHLPL